jgi:hypothetical protein
MSFFLEAAERATSVIAFQVTKNTYSSPQSEEHGYSPVSTEVQVLEVLKGRYGRQTLTLTGSSGSDCGFTGRLEPGSTWVVVLAEWDDKQTALHHYAILGCAYSLLALKNNQATGCLARPPDLPPNEEAHPWDTGVTVDLQRLRELLGRFPPNPK